MASIHLKAKALAKNGQWNEAWTVARNDNSMRPDVTRQVWEEWMRSVLAKPEPSAKSLEKRYLAANN